MQKLYTVILSDIPYTVFIVTTFLVVDFEQFSIKNAVIYTVHHFTKFKNNRHTYTLLIAMKLNARHHVVVFLNIISTQIVGNSNKSTN
jgi:hypothetical protein